MYTAQPSIDGIHQVHVGSNDGCHTLSVETEEMHLGIVVTTDASEPQASGLAQAAVKRGWACRCFLTDRGVLLLRSPRFIDSASLNGVRIDVCEHSWDRLGGGPHPAGVTFGSQYQDAELALQCDKVLVL